MAVPELAWYFRMRMGWGTGSSPTRVPCCRNLRISDSSVRPLPGMGGVGVVSHVLMWETTMKVKGNMGSPWTPEACVPSHTTRQAWIGPSSEPSYLPAPPQRPSASLVNADLLHLGNQHLQQPHDSL